MILDPDRDRYDARRRTKEVDLWGPKVQGISNLSRALVKVDLYTVGNADLYVYGSGDLSRELDQRLLFWHYPHYSNQGDKPGGAVRRGRFKLIEFYEDMRVELAGDEQRRRRP